MYGLKNIVTIAFASLKVTSLKDLYGVGLNDTDIISVIMPQIPSPKNQTDPRKE